PCAKIATIDEVVDNPQLRHRGQIVEVEHPNAGTVPMQGMVVKLSDTPGEIRLPPPSISEHTEQILNEWLGMNDSDVAQLRDDGVV
ncbi:MAG: CoA transferase, partial [Candidatus Latescibacteria bacterium]|nr:CoA transferase [Candidatus Latescibacterota bacterium]